MTREPREESLPLSPEVVGVLVDNHRRFLSFLEKRVGSREAAEDILQEAFVRGLQRGAQIPDDQSAVAWFYRVLRNALVDRYRRRDAEARAMERVTVLAGGDAVEDPGLMDEVCACVGALVGTLKPEYADVIRRVDLEGVPVDAAAQAAGITANNAHVRLHRARQALRRQVELSCGTCATHGCLDCGCKK